MAKTGKAKNTQNKAKHSKLIEKKKNKLRDKKIARENRLKSLIKKINQQKSQD